MSNIDLAGIYGNKSSDLLQKSASQSHCFTAVEPSLDKQVDKAKVRNMNSIYRKASLSSLWSKYVSLRNEVVETIKEETLKEHVKSRD